MTAETRPEDRKRERSRVSHELQLKKFYQPDDVTCGPTCLRKVYDYYGTRVPLETVVGEIDRNEDGGTLAVFLGISALRRGYQARIFSYDLRIFDPSWARCSMRQLGGKIEARLPFLRQPKTRRAARAYLEFLQLGGQIRFDELTPKLLKGILNRNHPVLAGLSATHLYRMRRERHDEETHELLPDDVGGDPTGHFVVISGYQRYGRQFIVRDPSEHIPDTRDGRLVVDAQRLINAILLGDLTYDAVLLELWRGEGEGANA